MHPNVTFFLIGFFIALFIIAICCIINWQIKKRKERLLITTLEKSKKYKLTVYFNNYKGKFFIFDTKEDLLKKLQRYPDNTYVEVNKQPMRIEDVENQL